MGGNTETALWVYATTLRGADGDDGSDGRGIVSVVRTSGTGAAGTTDTYTITYTDVTTSTFNVYNGADGLGAGDMVASTYDPNNKVSDAFSMGNMTETATAKIMTDTERDKLAGIATGAQQNAVDSVNEKTGAVSLNAADVGALPDDFTEADPTVPAWAKAPSKPDYTAADVGADASGTAASAVSTHNSNGSAHSSLFAAKQNTIAAVGLLKGAGDGSVSAATEGTDYVAPSALSSLLPKSGGTMTGDLTANNPAVANARVRNISAGTADLTAGSSSLTTGEVYFVYE